MSAKRISTLLLLALPVLLVDQAHASFAYSCKGGLNSAITIIDFGGPTDSQEQSFPAGSCNLDDQQQAQGDGSALGAGFASASSSAQVHADLNVVDGSFVFEGSSQNRASAESTGLEASPGSYLGTSATAIAGNQLDYEFALTSGQPVRYELTATLRGTPYNQILFDGEYVRATGAEALQFYQTGILNDTRNLLFSVMSAAEAFAYADGAVGYASATDLGTVNYRLVLTPVPIPAAAWLLMSGLSLVGVARRRYFAAAAAPCCK